jgi:predicted nucleotidyltransferase
MKDYDTRVARVCSRLNAEGARYVLVGSTAMQLWGTTRATQDVDILIEPSISNARNVLRALAALDFGFATEQLIKDVATRAVTVVGSAPIVDILTRACSLDWKTAQANATLFEVEGVAIPTASINDLIASKQTGLLQDRADIEVLEAIARHLASVTP